MGVRTIDRDLLLAPTGVRNTEPLPEVDAPRQGAPFNEGQEQADLLFARPQRHTLLVGGSRSGKTLFTCRAILVRGIRAPESRHAILRFRAVHAEASVANDTLPTAVRLFFPNLQVKARTIAGQKVFELPNGSQVWIGGLDEKERVEKILGQEFATLFFNECSQIPRRSVEVALTRLAQNVPGLRQRAYYDINPVGKGHWTYQLFVRHLDPATRKPVVDPENYARMMLNPEQNRANLTPEYLEQLQRLPERLRKRFYEGEYQDETEGALWSIEAIERCRDPDPAWEDYRNGTGPPPVRMRRIVVAIDPSGASDKVEARRGDDIGIVVAGLGFDERVYLIADLTCNGPPEVWGRVAVRAFHVYKADRIVAETNYGGDMVAYVIRSTDGSVPVHKVDASRGKVVRAEPVSVLYSEQQDKVRHVGEFPLLEDQLLNFSAAGYAGDRSPDRADAWVWAVTDLVLASNADSWISYYGKLAQGKTPAKAAEEDDKWANRPWRRPEPAVPEGNDLTEIYRQSFEMHTAGPQMCKNCGKPVVGPKSTDGEFVWHPRGTCPVAEATSG